MSAGLSDDAQSVLNFWFKDTPKSLWFSATDAFDADIRARFEGLASRLAAEVMGGKTHPWEDTAQGALALIITLDQFPRNMYRGTKGAFAWDPLALSVATRLCDANRDLQIDQNARAFVYMPFMHSENLADQERCVALVDARLDDSNTLHHAKEHARVIERFGRFPHRNDILGRDSTAEEKAFLNDGGYAP